jgi:hypothetical protein
MGQAPSPQCVTPAPAPLAFTCRDAGGVLEALYCRGSAIPELVWRGDALVYRLPPIDCEVLMGPAWGGEETCTP